MAKCESQEMRFYIYLAVALVVCAGTVLGADFTVRAVQAKLKAEGFYSGEVNGEDSSDTAAAITRFQIRNGLQINGMLDDETRRALGVAKTDAKTPTPKVGEDVWRYLRKSDQEYIERQVAAKSGQPAPAASASPHEERVYVAPPKAESHDAISGNERLNDYVGAFVLAGVNARVASELEFFAERVNYFDQGVLDRERIRRDLEKYDQRWPERRFRLAGPLQVKPESAGRLKVNFPLRYELRNGSKHAIGTVRKSLVLERAGDDFQIVSVQESREKR